MPHVFDRLVERRGTESNKWRKYDPDVLPLWVADMDFPSPPPVVRALAERVAHGIFGYGPTLEQVTELHELVAARLARLHGWRVAPETVVLLPGVIPGFNVACRMLAAPGDGLLLQLPLYPPIRRVPGNCGLTADTAQVAARTITLLAPSKTWNLAGLKCGLAVIPDAALRARFHAARADLVQTPNILGYTAAVAAYRDGEAWLADLRLYLEANRDVVVDFVRRALPGVTVAAPEAMYLAWLDCRGAGAAAADPYTFFLETARVALNDGTTFGPGGEGVVRLNFACPRARLVAAGAR